jgi:hypothetical protein
MHTGFYSPLKASIDSLTDHAALELGKGARDLKTAMLSDLGVRSGTKPITFTL